MLRFLMCNPFASFIQKLAACLVLLLFTGTQVRAQEFKNILLQSKLNNAYDINGIAIADYDNDNDLDIFMVQRWSNENTAAVKSKLYRNNNDGTFSNVTEQSGIRSSHNYGNEVVSGIYSFGEKMSASWGDYDNDGFPDLFLTNAHYIELYHNNQDGTFTNVTTGSGLSSTNKCYNNSGLWFDYNNDGFIDLYVTSIYDCAAHLYKNNKNGTFTDVSAETGLLNSGKTSWMSIPWDVNNDHFQDLYISRDFDLPNEFHINTKGKTFQNKAAELGIKDQFKDGMGLALGDYNNDGLTDLFITNIHESSLYQNMGTDTFINVANALNVAGTGWGWGCSFTDFDHDMDEDLVVLNGYFKNDVNKYYENDLQDGKVTFVEKASEMGMTEPSRSNCLAVFDYDFDGDMDMLISRTENQVEFLENQSVQSTDAHYKNWIQLKLVGTQSNRDAIGSFIKIKVGDHTLQRHYSGAVFMAQNQIPVHFGLGSYTKIDSLFITWPNGNMETYSNLASNQFLKITENQGYETWDVGLVKISGCTDPNSCSYNPNATMDDGSCTYLDSKPITGAATAGVLSTSTYSYPVTEGSEYYWEVENGTIVSGQGGPEITVQWKVATTGKITVIEKNNCVSEPSSLEVTLNISESPKHVSIARLWNEVLLDAIRHDYARPTVHARNLFHTSIALYDAWALFDETADTYFLGKDVHGFQSNFKGFSSHQEKEEAQRQAMSYAAYRILSHRFKHSPNATKSLKSFHELMVLLGYKTNFLSTNYTDGNAAALGNFLGQSIINYGMQDGSNEANKYANLHYTPQNEPLVPRLPGNPTLQNPNRWQPLKFDVFIDQAGNITSGSTPDFLSPEWGDVDPFAMQEEQATRYTRDGHTYTVYHDPGSPPEIGKSQVQGVAMDLYKWNYALVAVWSSHLDPADSILWDISPASMGNIPLNALPQHLEAHSTFYNFFEGGDISTGHSKNPVTGLPYTPQWVARGDYARILAEFWADGPDSETPPGHWFVLLNYINDQPEFKRQFKGEGPVLSPLEWDVKAYFTLGGTMHDAAIAAWAIKGWYDYIRPVSAIRYMAGMGQSTNPALENFHENGIPLIDGYIEVVQAGDPLATDSTQVGKIKIRAWKGHSYIKNPESEKVGVDWILAENWWPYQRPTFVTPPFAGYVSGHSTYSRAAAEVVTLLTGSPYFPGGIGEFNAPKNEFLVFEEGPSQDVVLQWATYQDASDQCSLSRIWGGIHPPADDIPGRLIGYEIGHEAFAMATEIFHSPHVGVPEVAAKTQGKAYPIPTGNHRVTLTHTHTGQVFYVYTLSGTMVQQAQSTYNSHSGQTVVSVDPSLKGMYILSSEGQTWKLIFE